MFQAVNIKETRQKVLLIVRNKKKFCKFTNFSVSLKKKMLLTNITVCAWERISLLTQPGIELIMIILSHNPMF